ncbi:hypothetical protein SUGI_0102130 [Cryptomeria japonica]|uniref:calmodulin-binding transcription activator 6 n=1 Tax=Cryptomeria japonica TaxID=3369 RepID=UPI002408D5E8|nr:calmodulin-binding transcription activator 6 [Cryptomeria japonica]GLJ09119.1 hypothetical protein SUGI_0102130 [Cryptomeria japonica]
MESSIVPGQLAGWETHGFHTMEDLDIYTVEEEAQSRWLRPNEIYAILCNYRHFSINAKPLDTPASGTLIMFDRKALRNFRKDGHAWQKKKDGKTVKEAHEHLKVGNEERIHVYYAHGEDNPKFVRRSYWLLDRAYEHIVLVHYREVSEVSNKSIVSPQGGLTGRSHLSKRIYTPVVSPVTPSNSSTSSAYSAKPTSWISSDELDSTENASGYTHQPQVSGFNATGNKGHQLSTWKDTGSLHYSNARTGSPEDLTIHQINTLDWEQLLEPQDSPEGISTEDITQSHRRTHRNGQFETIETPNSGSFLVDGLCSEAVQQLNDGDQKFMHESLYWEKPFQNNMPTGSTLVEFGQSEVSRSECMEHNQWTLLEQDKMIPNQLVEAQNLQSPSFEKAEHPGYMVNEVVEPPTGCEPVKAMNGNSFKKQDSFGRWLTSVLGDSPELTDEGSNNTYRQEEELDSHVTGDQSLVHGQVFCITEVSPMCGFSTEETKVIITGYFVGTQKDIVEAKWSCVFGEMIVPAEVVQIGVFRCKAPQHAPGIVNLFLTCNEQTPHSQILSFEYRVNAFIDLDKNFFAQTEEVLEEFALQIRLFHLLFSSFKGILAHGNKKTERVINIERVISVLFTNNEGDWLSLPKLVTEKRKSLAEAKSHLHELILKKKLQEWVLEKMVDKGGANAHDSCGQGVIHLVAALGYDWAVIPISCVGMSVNFRDRHGWTALHWAAFYGREQMVAALLAAGANASMVSDPTPESPGGWNPADLAFNKGYEGLAGYLAEKALTTHLENLTLYDKDDPRKQTSSSDFEIYEYLTEDEICMRDSLAAVRTATEAAAKINSAFREHTFKLKMKAFELADHSTTKEEALKMIAALKIQRAYKEHREKKKIVAARRIQHVFRGWKTRKEFLNLRRQVVKIQACFRGHQVRKHYCKILWSVGVLEKAILRWRLKRKGLRGLQVDTNMSSEHTEPEPEPESDNIEDFFRIGRKHAEERVERSVVRVQAMYRSYKARAEYRRMKQCHNQAQLQYDQLNNLDLNMHPRD